MFRKLTRTIGYGHKRALFPRYDIIVVCPCHKVLILFSNPLYCVFDETTFCCHLSHQVVDVLQLTNFEMMVFHHRGRDLLDTRNKMYLQIVIIHIRTTTFKDAA